MECKVKSTKHSPFMGSKIALAGHSPEWPASALPPRLVFPSVVFEKNILQKGFSEFIKPYKACDVVGRV